MKQLYVTYWAPNGTNDLLICDDSSQILTVIEEATFGIDVRHDSRIDEQPAAYEDFVGCATLDELEAGTATLVKAVDLETVLERIAISPVNDGRKTIERIKQAMGN